MVLVNQKTSSLARLCDIMTGLSKLNVLRLSLFLLWHKCMFPPLHFTTWVSSMNFFILNTETTKSYSLWDHFLHKTFLATWESLLFAGWHFSHCHPLGYAAILDCYRQNVRPTHSLIHTTPNFLKRKDLPLWISALALVMSLWRGPLVLEIHE